MLGISSEILQKFLIVPRPVKPCDNGLGSDRLIHARALRGDSLTQRLTQNVLQFFIAME